ncbi:MAG: hypothetical protein VYA55_07200 [Pseudomonadota bacterium]|nr:hypothetical protein [Pseudomonadota bacterium]
MPARLMLAVLLMFHVLPSYAAAEPPVHVKFMLGEWEATVPSNRYRMKIIWDQHSEELLGYLTKNGTASGQVGFTINEHIFTAKTVQNPTMVIAIQKYRSGTNGISNWHGWVTATIDLKESSSTQLVATYPPYLDGSNSKTVYKRIYSQR